MFLKTTICLSRSMILLYRTALVVGVVLLTPPLSHTSSCLLLSAQDSLGSGLATVDLTGTQELSLSILSKVVNLLSSPLSSLTDVLISYANLHSANCDSAKSIGRPRSGNS